MAVSNNLEILRIEDIEFILIVKNVRRLSMRPDNKGNRILVNLPVLMKNRRNEAVQFIYKNLPWAKKVLQKVRERQNSWCENHSVEEVDKFVEGFKIQFNKRAVEMNLMHRVRKLRFQYMKSRWGSCNHNSGALSFNLYLINKSGECIDYVIVHELAHLVHPNHSASFWNHVAIYCPEYKKIRKILKS